MNLKFLRAFRNPAFIGGVVLLLLGGGPLVIFAILQEFGLFPGNNGLGFGLLFVFTLLPAGALIVGGCVVAVRRADGAGGKGAAKRTRLRSPLSRKPLGDQS